MIVITPRAKWERMVCVTTFWLKKENGGKCVAERIPITLIGTFLSLQVHCRDALLTRRWWELLVLVLSSKSVVAQVWGGRKHGRHWIGKWFSANALRALIHNLRRNCKILHATHILFSILRTLPKAQRTRGLSSACQSNLFRSYHKFLHKSWSDFIFRRSTRHQMISI